jgi:hypothetical protein
MKKVLCADPAEERDIRQTFASYLIDINLGMNSHTAMGKVHLIITIL